jgi:hypothetical protein
LITSPNYSLFSTSVLLGARPVFGCFFFGFPNEVSTSL